MSARWAGASVPAHHTPHDPRDNLQEVIMSLTITHPVADFTGEHSGLAFVDGVAELPALEADAREPLLANGFTIAGEDEVPETEDEKAARIAKETEDAQRAADDKAKADAAEAQRLADEKAEADKAAAAKAADKK